MPKYETMINNTILLQEISPKDIRRYLNEGRFRLSTYEKNAVIHLEGELCTRLEIIITGEIVVEHMDEAGGLLTIAQFVSNDMLGGNLLFSNNPYFPMITTAKAKSTILSIEKELLFKLFCNNPAFLRKFLEYVSDRTAVLGYKIKNHALKTIRESLMSYLMHESKMQKTNKIKLRMTKKALADRIGVQRTSLSRELTKMKNDGLILFDAESITIL